MLRPFLSNPPSWTCDATAREKSTTWSLPEYIPRTPDLTSAASEGSAHKKDFKVDDNQPKHFDHPRSRRHAPLSSIAWLVEQQSLTGCLLLPRQPSLRHEPEQLVSLSDYKPPVGNLPVLKSSMISPTKLEAKQQAGRSEFRASVVGSWQSANLQPISPAIPAFYITITVSELTRPASLTCRMIAEIYQTSNLGSLLPIGGREGCIFTYANPTERQGTAWLIDLQRVCCRVRQFLTAGKYHKRPLESSLKTLDTPILVFLSLPAASPRDVARALATASLTLGRHPPVVGAMPWECAAGSGLPPLPNEDLTSAYHPVQYASEGAAKEQQPGVQMPAVTIQVLTHGDVADISGERMHGIPFSIFLKLCDPGASGGFSGDQRGGAPGNPILLVASENASAAADSACLPSPEQSGDWWHFCYHRVAGNAAVLGWSRASGAEFGSRLLKLQVQKSSKARKGGEGPGTPKRKSEEFDDLSTVRSQKAQKIDSGKAGGQKGKKNYEDAEAAAEDLVSSVLDAALQVTEACGSAAECVICCQSPMPDPERVAWLKILKSRDSLRAAEGSQGRVFVAEVAFPTADRHESDFDRLAVASLEDDAEANLCCKLKVSGITSPMQPRCSEPEEILRIRLVTGSFQKDGTLPEHHTGTTGIGDEAEQAGPRRSEAPKPTGGLPEDARGGALEDAGGRPISSSSAEGPLLLQIARDFHGLSALSLGLRTLQRLSHQPGCDATHQQSPVTLPLHVAVAEHAAELFRSIGDQLTCPEAGS